MLRTILPSLRYLLMCEVINSERRKSIHCDICKK